MSARNLSAEWSTEQQPRRDTREARRRGAHLHPVREAPDIGARGRLWRPVVERRVVFAFDAGACLLAVVAALALQRGLWWPVVVAPTALYLVAAPLAGLIRPGLSVSLLDDLPRLALAFGVTTVVCVELLGAIRPEVRGLTISFCALLGIALMVSRALGDAVVRSLRSRSLVVNRSIVVGADDEAVDLVTAARRSPELGLVPLGFVADDADVHERAAERGWAVPDAPLLGQVADLPELVRATGADRVVVAMRSPSSSAQAEAVVNAVRGCEGCEVWQVPAPLGVMPRGSTQVSGIVLVPVASHSRDVVSRVLKRGLDLVVAGLGLLLVAPLLLTLMLVSRLLDGPGVVYRQERVGRGGRPFSLMKIRSVRAEPEGAEGQVWSIDGDPRVTPLGRVLRRTCLDELPQLWNVLRGDMSVIGPRPERPQFVEEFAQTIPHYRWRHRADVGLTGLAQVSGLRGDTSVSERATVDNAYIEGWSLWLDLKIIARTLGAVVRPAKGKAKANVDRG